jgi:hypothetical protein
MVKRRLLGPLAGLALVLAIPGAAIAATVTVRVEGRDATLLPATTVTTDATAVNKDGDPTHTCAGDSAAGALEQATRGQWGGQWFSGLGYSVETLLGEAHAFPDPEFWSLVRSNVETTTGVCDTTLQNGDEVLFFVARCDVGPPPDYACTNPPIRPLGLLGVPRSVRRGQAFTVRVVRYDADGTASPAAGATVEGGGVSAVADSAGAATLTLAGSGPAALRARRADSARSASRAVCVEDGAGSCGSAPPAGAGGGPGAPRLRYRAPDPQILGLTRRVRLAAGKGPRELRGRINLGTLPLLSVRLRLTRKSGGRCEYFSGSTESFRRTRCGTGWSFAIGDRARWSYLLPERLGPGRYVFEVIAKDATGATRAEDLVFFVKAKASRRAQAASSPKVEVYVVGRAKVLAAPAKVRARAVSVKVGRRPCSVAAGTALAALEGLRKKAGPSYGLRDFGSCSRRAADAAGLFVTRIGPDRNRGQAGWAYKVGRRGATTSAADPSGPFGTGRRLRAGDRVTWFWCVLGGSGGCQRTLEAQPAARSVAPGAALAVTVRGYDDEGRGEVVAGATVTLGAARAVTDAAGRATLTAPVVGGRLDLVARRAGLVRSFPVEVGVG